MGAVRRARGSQRIADSVSDGEGQEIMDSQRILSRAANAAMCSFIMPIQKQ